MPNPLGDIVTPLARLERQIEALGEELAPVAALDQVAAAVEAQVTLTAELLEEIRGLRADLAKKR